MMIELEATDIKINLVSPAFTKTRFRPPLTRDLRHQSRNSRPVSAMKGTESVENGSREVVRVALLGPDGPTGTFTRWENTTIPW
jgi:hypothetical protein